MPENKPVRILVLDDQHNIVDTLCMILNQSGFEARGVYTHEAAILAAREFKPDAFLTGFYNLCDKNGCETAAEIRTFIPQCRVMIFTGNAGGGAYPVIEDYQRRGYGFEVSAKPLHPQDLLRFLRSHEPPAAQPDETAPVPEV